MKRFFAVLTFVSVINAVAVAQSGSNNFIPELVFQNPVLVSGVAGQDGAVYKFSNVATDIDATVKVSARSAANVVLTNIDVANMGWSKALQPQFGIQGNVPANKDWWMDFEVIFYKAGTTVRKKIKGFQVTAIDVDGDGVSIREYIQMNRVSAVAYCPVNYLAPQAPINIPSLAELVGEGDNNKGSDKMSLGPVQNFYNIDTAGTPVMSTYTYEDKDKITFRYGAKSGAVISNAGERLNSLWFKAFSLTPPQLLPIVFYSFNANYDKKNVNLSWSAQADDDFGTFVIERSVDGKNFEVVGQLAAKANRQSYTFSDAGVTSASGIVYYRIQSREKSGERNYSSIKLIRLNKEANSSLAVYPNPVQRTANVTLPASWQSKPIAIRIFNSTGMLVKMISLQAASQTESVDFSQLPAGMYVVKAQCHDELAEQRVIRN